MHALSLVQENGRSDDARGAGRTLVLNVNKLSRSERASASLEDAMAVIAMTREMATLGKDVASGLAERLGLTVVHHELVKQGIAERAGMRESEVHRFLEGEASLLQRWKIDHKRLSRYTAQEILDLAVKGNVLIRGWGATYLLRSVPHVICVRICAPMSFREEVLMKRLGLGDRLLARREIEGNDTAHNGTMQKLFGIDWTDPSLYTILLNTARVPVKDCVEHIVRLAESSAFQETPESRAKLTDDLILSRVRATIEQRFAGIDAQVRSGKVTLTGGSSDERMIVEAIRLVHSIEGVTGVESQIRHIAFQPST
jgi:cytidylate kinase